MDRIHVRRHACLPDHLFLPTRTCVKADWINNPIIFHEHHSMDFRLFHWILYPIAGFQSQPMGIYCGSHRHHTLLLFFHNYSGGPHSQSSCHRTIGSYHWWFLPHLPKEIRVGHHTCYDIHCHSHHASPTDDILHIYAYWRIVLR